MARYLYSKAVAGHEYAQAHENFFDDGTIELWSYTTRRKAGSIVQGCTA